MSPANAFYPSGFTSFLHEVVKPKTMAVIYESSDFGSSGAEVILKQAGRLGISVLVKEKYEKGMTDFGSILSQVKRERPDVIYMVSYVMDAAHLIRQVKKLEIDVKLLTGGAAGFAIPEFIFLAGDASEYVTTATLWVPEAAYPGARLYADKYRAGYGENPSYHGAEAYSALYVVKDVLERAKTWTPEDIRDAMKRTDLMTAFGPIKFEDREGYTNQNFMDTLVIQVIKGRHETIWPEKYATQKYVYPIPKWKDRK
jgi:branched-chain amino acid transport system substrate-binding protein